MKKYINYFVVCLFFVSLILLLSLIFFNLDISFGYYCYVLNLLVCLLFFRSLIINKNKTYNSFVLYSIIYFFAVFGMFYFNYKEPSYYLFVQSGLIWFALNFMLLMPMAFFLVFRDETYKSYWRMAKVLFLTSLLLQLVQFILGISHFDGTIILNICGGLFFLYLYNKVLCKFRLSLYYSNIENHKNIIMVFLFLVAVILTLADYKIMLSLFLKLFKG